MVNTKKHEKNIQNSEIKSEMCFKKGMEDQVIMMIYK